VDDENIGGLFLPACHLTPGGLLCSIDCEESDVVYAFYIDINGERRKQYWYTEKSKVLHPLMDEVINTYQVTFFVRRNNGEIISKTISKRSRWALCDGVLEAVFQLTTEGSSILEFGSGFGSKLISEHRTISCIEHNKKFINLFEGVNYVYAPLAMIDPFVGFEETKWYDFEEITTALPNKIDMIIIDGPPQDIGRSGVLRHLDRFSETKFWIIDDIQREKDQKLANYISFHFSMIQYRFWNFSILSKKSIPSEIIENILNISNSIANKERKEYLAKFYPLTLRK